MLTPNTKSRLAGDFTGQKNEKKEPQKIFLLGILVCCAPTTRSYPKMCKTSTIGLFPGFPGRQRSLIQAELREKFFSSSCCRRPRWYHCLWCFSQWWCFWQRRCREQQEKRTVRQCAVIGLSFHTQGDAAVFACACRFCFCWVCSKIVSRVFPVLFFFACDIFLCRNLSPNTFFASTSPSRPARQFFVVRNPAGRMFPKTCNFPCRICVRSYWFHHASSNSRQFPQSDFALVVLRLNMVMFIDGEKNLRKYWLMHSSTCYFSIKRTLDAEDFINTDLTILLLQKRKKT